MRGVIADKIGLIILFFGNYNDKHKKGTNLRREINL